LIRALAFALAVPMLIPSASAQTVPEPQGYRMDTYRAPVPGSLAGATTLGPEQAYALWSAGNTAFIDVLPQPPKPADLPEGTIWRDKPHDTIPGAIWLPNVGYGAIADVTAEYFRKGLAAATGNDSAAPVVIFCLADCWMSWNAGKRAIEWGYTSVYWLPEGVDGWSAQTYPVERVQPQGGQPQTGG
jgi:PQQ-dependent catabolism-associated CXXCW motif protein